MKSSIVHLSTPIAPPAVRFHAVVKQTVVLRDALVTLLAEQRRKFMSGGKLCVETVLCALLETREASLEVIDAITR